MKKFSKKSNTHRRNNVIDFSKRKRDLSHLATPKQPKKPSLKKINFSFVKYLSVLILLLLMTASFYTFINSQYALIQEITITGNFLLEEQEILVNLPQKGQANFYKTPNNHFEEIIKENPWIKDVNVSKNFISRTVDLEIIERRPLFRTVTDSQIEIISEDGKVIPDRSGLSGANVPFVTGNNDQRELLLLIEHIKEIPNYFLEQVSEINIENTASVVLYTIDGFIIKIGVIENLTADKVTEVQKIIDLEKFNGNRGTIDIRGHNIIFDTNLEG